MLRRATVSAVLALALASFGLAQVQTKESQAAITPGKAVELLKEGNARFVSGKTRHRDLAADVKATAAGQYPYAAVISCMDSRAPMEIVLDQGIGDMFSLRTAGNVVDTDFLGSLEYAVKVVGVRLVAVVGHTHCGAVKGAIDNVDMGNLTALLGKIGPAIAASGPGTSKDARYVDKVAEQNVRHSLREIRERSQIVREALDSGKTGIVAGMYDIDTGKVVFSAD
ncbi:MAG TPA: carbonic anhydrase family protein [Thermoanaerobaculia bacterium]|nr:carbonic anhydrase family protein [Thermoanaerobaculia bacterium]